VTDFHGYGLICCICYSGLTPEQCAVDEHSDRWDVCSSKVSKELVPCARQAGIVEVDPELAS
jgi:hypothetical protein